jgi:cobalt-zinc-cadmium efflux system membrane fusion protein
MSGLTTRWVRRLVLGVAALALVGILAAAGPLVGVPNLLSWWTKSADKPATPGADESPVERVPGQPDALQLPPDVVERLGIRTIKARRATEPRTLDLSGKLALDTNQLARVHARFPGEVVEIEKVPDPTRSGGPTRFRELRPGDRVEAGQLLAVVWSKDLGEKKSELVDALSQLRLDRAQLEHMASAAASGALSESALRDARRRVESDMIAVARAERTLRSWRLTEQEIEDIRAEAERLSQRKEARTPANEKDWAKVEVRARIGGTVVERNVTPGDIVDTSTDLFKVADLGTLAVWADAYEEDLPALLALPPERMTWTIRLVADPDAEPLHGPIDYIGEIIDPIQHTALVTGRVNNPQGRLRAGQFVTARVELQPAPDEMAVPTAALIEDGQSSIVFVQENPARPVYTRRRVVVVRRLRGSVILRGWLTPAQERRGLQTVRPGELVVRSGAVELNKALEELQDEARGKE